MKNQPSENDLVFVRNTARKVCHRPMHEIVHIVKERSGFVFTEAEMRELLRSE